ncbi:MAG: CDP-alcohol phosphatidyltransferase family protein, partial [Candidatus Cryptobacteroides sp.]
MVFSFGPHPEWAFYCMLAAAVFDFCDGFAARLLNAYSPMGKELDSLCDVVSFGVLPSVMMYNNMKVFAWGAEKFWAFLPLLLSIGVALRLAKFNVDERQHESFLG